MARKVKEDRFVLIFEFVGGVINCRADYILTSTDSMDDDLDQSKDREITLAQGQARKITLIRNEIFADLKASEE